VLRPGAVRQIKKEGCSMANPRKASEAEIEQLKLLLCLAFPKAFFPKGEPKRPLRIGIFNELKHSIKKIAPGVSNSRLQAAMHSYTTGGRYLMAVRKGTPRIGLNGETNGFVTREQEIAARKESQWLLRKKKMAARAAVEPSRLAAAG
jgi:sRNA-binding protein